jgi:hypothetical protein
MLYCVHLQAQKWAVGGWDCWWGIAWRGGDGGEEMHVPVVQRASEEGKVGSASTKDSRKAEKKTLLYQVQRGLGRVDKPPCGMACCVRSV